MAQLRTFTSSALPAYDRGVEFGERHRSQVARTVAAYGRLFAARAVGPFDVDAWSEHAWQAISALTPEAAQEIRGIADGAGLPVQQIAALNARTELLAIANPTGVDECSTVVALSPGRAPIAVQTWDWYDAMADGWLRWTIPHPDGRVVETVTEYGVLGKIGVNSNGLGVLLNMLHHANDADPAAGSGHAPGDGGGPQHGRIGFPVHLLSRHILDNAGSLDEAMAMTREVATSASTSLTIVEGRPEGGRSVSVELFPGGPGVLEPDDGLLVRTNHFVSEQGRPGCLASTIGPGSEIRRTTLLRALSVNPPTCVDDVVRAMDDHADVGGVCCHPDPATDPVLQHSTLATVAVDTVGHTLEVTAGGPCARADAATTARA